MGGEEGVLQGRGRVMRLPQPKGEESFKGSFHESLTCPPFALGQSFPTLR